MWKLIFGIIVLSTLVLAKDETKIEVDKKVTEKRGATSFTHIVRGGTRQSSIASHGATTPFQALQIAYIPLAAYEPGYSALTHATVQQPYPVAVEKTAPYPIKIAFAVPEDRPYPVHIIKPYPTAIEKPVLNSVENPIPYSVKIPVEVPILQPVHYAVPTPYPATIPFAYPVHVKPLHHGYDTKFGSTEHNSPEDTSRESYSSYSDSNYSGHDSYYDENDDGSYKNGYSRDGH